MADPPAPWDPALVRRWLERRVAAARTDQVTAQRAGRGAEDDCDKAAAEELVCQALLGGAVPDSQAGFAAAVKALQVRERYVARGVFDDDRFDRHVRAQLRKLARMAKLNDGFGNTRHYQ